MDNSPAALSYGFKCNEHVKPWQRRPKCIDAFHDLQYTYIPVVTVRQIYLMTKRTRGQRASYVDRKHEVNNAVVGRSKFAQDNFDKTFFRIYVLIAAHGVLFRRGEGNDDVQPISKGICHALQFYLPLIKQTVMTGYTPSPLLYRFAGFKQRYPVFPFFIYSCPVLQKQAVYFRRQREDAEKFLCVIKYRPAIVLPKRTTSWRVEVRVV